LRIDPQDLFQALRAYLGKPSPPGTVSPAPVRERSSSPSPAPGEGDRLVLSPRAREIQRLRSELLRLPEVRKDKVHSLRARIAAGSYQIKPEEVAEKMLAEVGRPPEGRRGA